MARSIILKVLVLAFICFGNQGCGCIVGSMLMHGMMFGSGPRIVCYGNGMCQAVGGVFYNAMGMPMNQFGPGMVVYDGYGRIVPPSYYDFPTNGMPGVPGGYAGSMQRERMLATRGYK